MANYFFTGFPGFISIHLIKKMIQKQYEVDKIYLLVLPSMIEKAERTIETIREEINSDQKDVQFEVVKGNITKPNLNIDSEVNDQLKDSVTYVYHLAAIYDLAVPQDIAYEVNVKGTDYVNQWVETLSRLKRYVYFSTAYVAGTREGPILETELVMNQGFKNHYESTKYEAEVLVDRMKDRVPVTIIRPGVVVGNSETGDTTKFDGPYFLLNFFNRLRFMPIIPYLGRGKAQGNFVPIDYIINATTYLAHSEKGIGKTYHLTDSKPYQMREVYQMFAQKFLGRKPVGTIPLSFAKGFISVPFLRRWLKVEKEALDYFTFKSEYDSTQATQDLNGSGITCPDFSDVTNSIITYYERHKDDEEKHIDIK